MLTYQQNGIGNSNANQDPSNNPNQRTFLAEGLQRLSQPLPAFFRVLRNVGLAAASVAAVIVAAPVALPSVVITFAGYLGLSGSVIAAVSQLTNKTE